MIYNLTYKDVFMNVLSPAIAADFAAIAYETLKKVSLNSTDYYSRIGDFFIG